MGSGFYAYAIWWICHSAWLLSVGVSSPEKGWNTVFEDMYRSKQLGPAFTECFGCSSKRAHAAVYLAIHFAADMLAFVSPCICWYWPKVHAGFCIYLFVSAAYNGASYYNYLLTHKYEKVVKKVLETQQHT